jgi:hypothetical protein
MPSQCIDVDGGIFENVYRLHPVVYIILIAYARTVDTTSDMGISSIKTIGVSTNITQVIKILVIIWFRILATNGFVASEYVLYIRYITTI